MSDATRILLVDGDNHFRAIVKQMIRRHYPAIWVNEARNREEALAQAMQWQPGLVLTEIDFRDRRALDLPQRLHDVDPNSVIVVLTNLDAMGYREVSLRGGAQHFISKSRPTSKIIRKILDAQLGIGARGSDREKK